MSSRFTLPPRRPILLDLFAGAGGVGVGYERAGFDVYAVDLHPMPNNPHPMHQGDALDVLARLLRGEPIDFTYRDGRVEWLRLGDLTVIHASPPCQHYTPLGALSPEKIYPDLVAPTRDMLVMTGKPYVIENVMAAPLIKAESIVLCGGMFGLRTYRHRRFESNLSLSAPEHPRHVIRTATKRRRELWDLGWHVSITGDVGTYLGPGAMGINWMSGNELSQAIPPAYTEFIGTQLMVTTAERVET